MKRYYKKIDSTLELKNFDDVAAEVGNVAVGISNSGSLYKWNRETRRPEKISNSEAVEILQITPEELDKIIETRGAFEIVKPVEEAPVQEPTPVEVVTPTEEVKQEVQEVCIKAHYDDVVALIKVVHDEVKSLKEELHAENIDLKAKIDNLENVVTELKNFIILE